MTTAPLTKQTGHSFLGPSSAERWFSCPGSINLIATLPPEAFKQSKYAAEGTVAHTIAEEYVTGKASLVELMDRIGEYVMQNDTEVEIIEDMVNGAVEYDDAIKERIKAMDKPIKVHAFAEQRVHASSIDEYVWGTADYVIFQKGGRLVVVDYKFGKGVVEAEANKQMMVYAVAVEDFLAGSVFDEIELVIVQPRARHAEGSVRSFTMSSGELNVFRAELKAAVARTKDPNAQRVAGSWCKFCPALAYCPEVRVGVEKAAQTTFTKLPAPPSKEVGASFLPDPNKFTPEQLAHALEWKPSIEAWYKAIEARGLEELMKDPDSVPGWKVVKGRKNRVWGDAQQVENAFALQGDKIFAPRKLISPSQMEKIVGKEEVAKFAITPEGEPSLVEASDKRPALTVQSRAQDVFDALPPQVQADKELSELLFGTSTVLVTDEGKAEVLWP